MHPWNAGDWGSFGWPWPGILWLIAFLLFWGGLIALLIWAVRLAAAPRREDAETILRRRLASGEITEEEYEHLRELLRQ